MDRRATRTFFFVIVLNFEAREQNWIGLNSQANISKAKWFMHRIKIRLFRYLVPIIGISHPHQPCYSLPTGNSFFISSTSRRWPFVSTWHRLPSSKFEDGNVVGRKKLTKRYSFSLSKTHTQTLKVFLLWSKPRCGQTSLPRASGCQPLPRRRRRSEFRNIGREIS